MNLSNLLFLYPEKIKKIKNKLNNLNNSKYIFPSYQKLIREADNFCEEEEFTVTNKDKPPPSGDIHDYMSLSKYWWPNENSKDGLSYVRHDGKVNPEAKDDTFDRQRLGKMLKAIKTLTFAFYFSGDKKYGEKAVSMIKTWFLNEDTRMNPNMKYAQAVPGQSAGRSYGIIDSSDFFRLADYFNLLGHYKILSRKDHKKLKAWFGEYLNWLLKSENGREESDNENNHGSWYDVQVSSIAIFTGKINIAEKTVRLSKNKRIAKQIEPKGRQPLEIKRTKGLDYSIYNIRALLRLSQIGKKIGIDLLNYRPEKAGSIQDAIDWLLPYLTNPEMFPYKQIEEYKVEKGFLILRLADILFDNKHYEKYIEKLPKFERNESIINLINPSEQL